MENITIIATIPTQKETINIRTISDEDFLLQAKQEGKIYTLKEFERTCNDDTIAISSVFIRVLEVSKSSFRLV